MIQLHRRSDQIRGRKRIYANVMFFSHLSNKVRWLSFREWPAVYGRF